MPSDPLTSWTGVAPGSVVIVAKLLPDRKRQGADFWWRSFRVVTDILSARTAVTVILKMDIDPDKDARMEQLPAAVHDENRSVITLLTDHEIPQGVSAMLMKGIATEKIVIVPF